MTNPANIPANTAQTAAETAWDIVYFPLGAAAFGGAERSLLELAFAQQGKGMRVLICYERALDESDFVAQARARGLNLQRIDWAPEDTLLDVARAATNLFRGLDTRLIHFNIAWRQHMWLIPVLARVLSKARLIGSMRAMPDDYSLIPRGRYLGFIPGPRLWILPDLFIGRVWAKTMHITVSVNRDDYPPRLIREFGFAADRLRVVYNGVPIPPQMPDQATRREAKVRFGIPGDAFIAAYVGRVSVEKGIHFAIDAIAICDSRVHLLVAGDGDQLDELKERVQQLGIADRVHFLGYVSDPLSVFSASDVALVPSLWNEAFGRVVVEAMACGTVVIATAVGGMKELFTDGQEGFFVPKADAPAISNAINRLAGDRKLWERQSLAGRLLAESRYATQRVAAEYGKIYSEMARSGSRS